MIILEGSFWIKFKDITDLCSDKKVLDRFVLN